MKRHSPTFAGAFAVLLALAACEAPDEQEPGDEAKGASGQSWSHADEEALMVHADEPWTGDLDGMRERGFIRVLTVYNPLFFFYDGAEKSGLTYEAAEAFEAELNKSRKKGRPPVRVLMIPMPGYRRHWLSR